MKVYFFPGLGADASLDRYHHLPGHDVEWVEWPKDIQPDWDRFDEDILRGNRIEPGAVFVGISFGGMVAQRIARFRKPVGIVLISSLTDASSISPPLRACKPLVHILPAFLFNMGLISRSAFAWFFGVKREAHVSHLMDMGRRLKPIALKRLNLLALEFRRIETGVPVLKIHGGQDRIILARSEARDVIVQGGGHLISMTHSQDVNAAILKWINQVAVPNGMRINPTA